MSLKPDSPCVESVSEAVNFGDRRGGHPIDILMLHYTGMNDGDGALKWLCCEESGVSCHYFVLEDGRIVQLVAEARRAHHAGAGAWAGDDDINSRSIGVEIVNVGHPGGLPDFPKVQMQAVAQLSRDIVSRYKIPARRVLAHSDTAPGRKCDPGENFDWQWLSEQGVGHWVAPSPIRSGRFFQQGDTGEPVQALQSMLALYGYEQDISGTFCERTHVVVEAFQRHFRQEKVDGVADISTIETLHNLLRSVE